METLTHLFKVLTLLVLSRFSFQQEAVNKTDNCFDSQYVCASENQCAYTFVLPRPDGETCPSAEETVRDMGRLVEENEEFKQILHEIQGELIRLKAALGYGETVKDGVCPASSESSRTIVIDCMQVCEGDQDCPGRKKCCQIGCDVICVDPAPDVPAESEYEVCWSGDMCNQCDRGLVGGINGLDVCCPHCRQSGLRIIDRSCTCAKDRSPDDDGEGGDGDNYESPITEDSWTQRTFLYDDKYNSCHGDQYVKLSGYDVGRYVGVILCSSERYKIFLSDDLDGVFLNVADSNGHGQDHCEFLGGTEESSNIDNDFWDSPLTHGYCRSDWGESPRLTSIGGETGSTRTGKYYVRWIECGLTIPDISNKNGSRFEDHFVTDIQSSSGVETQKHILNTILVLPFFVTCCDFRVFCLSQYIF